jgi:hypothetical protein
MHQLVEMLGKSQILETMHAQVSQSRAVREMLCSKLRRGP